MNRVIGLLVVAMVTITTFAQDGQLSKKELRLLEKELKNEQLAEEAAQKAEIVRLMVTYQRFVLEANRLRDKRGSVVNVPPMINFIASDSIYGVIQIGSDSYVGLNGVGGITIEGPISNYTYKLNQKSGSYNVSYHISSINGHYDVRMTIFQDGRADANISSNWPGQINYMGYLVPPAVSKVYKGMSY